MKSLDELVALDREELDSLFEQGEAPEPEELEGEASGALLAGRGLFDTAVFRRLLNTPLNPWRGKSFGGGEGTNLVGYSPLSTELFDFEARTGESLVDGEPVVVLDYDQPDNPAIARRVRDEVRRVGDDIYLVSTNFQAMDGYRFVGYYGLDASQDT